MAEAMRAFMPDLAGGGGQAVTDDNGDYAVEHLAPGTYEIFAKHPDFAPSAPVTVTVKEDQVATAPGLVLSVGGTIELLVIEKGEPKTGLMVQLMGDGMKMATTDGEGRCSFDSLKPGDYMLNLVEMGGAGGMALKTRTATIQGSETVDIEVEYGTGSKVHGKVTGLPAGGMKMILLRRPGGPNPEDLDPLDMSAQMEASKYNAGIGMVTPAGTYTIADVEPGEYIMEIPRTPDNLADAAAYAEMDRTPYFRKTVSVVAGSDLEVDIKVKASDSD